MGNESKESERRGVREWEKKEETGGPTDSCSRERGCGYGCGGCGGDPWVTSPCSLCNMAAAPALAFTLPLPACPMPAHAAIQSRHHSHSHSHSVASHRSIDSIDTRLDLIIANSIAYWWRKTSLTAAPPPTSSLAAAVRTDDAPV